MFIKTTIIIYFILIFNLFAQNKKFEFNTSHHQLEIEAKNSRILKWDDPLDDVYNYDVQNYEIHIDVSDVENKKIKGNVLMSAVTATSGFKEIIIDLHDDLSLDSIFVKIDNTAFYELNFDNDLSRNNHRFFVNLPYELNKGAEFEINTYYSGAAIAVENEFGNANGLSFDTYSQGLSIYTLSEPNESRFWFPCKDIPRDKALSEIYITTLPEHSAVSNGSLISEEIDKNGMKITHWQEKYPIAVYLISIAVSDYQKHEDYYTSLDGKTVMPVDCYIYPTQGWVLNKVDFTPEAIKCYAERFGEYPYLDEKYCTASIRQIAAMEHQTCSSMGGYWEGTVVHELAHQWFGNQITCATWDDTWINEGGATYLEGIWYEHLYGPEGMSAYMQQLLLRPASFDLLPITDQDFALTSTHYKKGAWIYHMLRFLLGDDNFFDSLKKLLNDSQYSYNSLNSEEYLTCLDSISGVNLDKFYEQWIVKGGFPVYEFSYQINNSKPATQDSELLIQIKQKQDITDLVPIFSMPIPIKIEFEDSSEEIITLSDSLPVQNFKLSFDKKLKKSMYLENFDYGNRILCKKNLIPYEGGNSTFYESFENDDELPLSWEVYDEDDNGNSWNVVHDSSSVQIINNFVTVNNNLLGINDDWLILPKVQLDSSTFNFYAKSHTADAIDNFEIRLSFDDNKPEDFTEIIAEENEIPEKWQMYSYDLTADNNAEVFVAIRYTSENGSGLDIDNIFINNKNAINNDDNLPQKVTLNQNYPNPFNSTTMISYELQTADFVEVIIYNSAGEKVWTTVKQKKEAGKYNLLFDGAKFNSGIYFYSIKINGNIKATKKMALIK